MKPLQQFKPDLKRMWKEGFRIAINCPVNSGPTLTVKGTQEAATALSDLQTLSQYSQIEIIPSWGGTSTFIETSTLINKPLFIVGFQLGGFPILLGEKSTEGHITILGPTRTGKSLNIGSMVWQLTRLGRPVFVIGCKAMDPLLLASIKAGCESPTWLDATGRPALRRAWHFTMQPGLNSKAFNPFAQKRSAAISQIVRSGALVRAVSSGSPASDPSARYFAGASVDMLLKVDFGQSASQLNANIEKLKLGKDELYSTASVRNEIAQIAAIEHVNRPLPDPESIDIERIILNREAAYFDPNAQDTGTLATSLAGLFCESIIATKRVVWPRREERIFVIIDEAQIFPREYLKQLIEQASSSGITLILAYHTLAQMGDDAETISMTAVRIILGAVPGSSTDRHLQSLFGTHKVWRRSFSQGAGTSQGTSVTNSSGPGGGSVSHGYSESTSQQSGFGFSETEEPVWTPNDTLALNYNREHFVCMVSPGADLAHFGPGAVLATRDGVHMSFDKINRLAEEALNGDDATVISNPSTLGQIGEVSSSHMQDETRAKWVRVLSEIAAKLKASIG